MNYYRIFFIAQSIDDNMLINNSYVFAAENETAALKQLKATKWKDGTTKEIDSLNESTETEFLCQEAQKEEFVRRQIRKQELNKIYDALE
jgi:hypothetical protein